ncbi:MAG: hypothetical protein AB8G99_01255 [Planctomycetaceae bacterium]
MAFDNRATFNSDVWRMDEYAVATRRALMSWEASPPSVDEFRRLVESTTCSDCTYECFFYALPYVLDELERRPAIDQFEMVSMLDWKLINAVDANVSEACHDQLHAELDRITGLLVKILSASGCPSDVIKYNLGAIAALHGLPELGNEIHAIGE